MSKHNIEKYGISRADLNVDDFEEFDDMIDETRAVMHRATKLDDGTRKKINGGSKFNKPVRVQREYDQED